MAAGGTQVVTGSGINQDALSWLTSLGAYDLGDRRLALDTRGQQDAFTLGIMDLQSRMKEIDNQYDVDVKRLGLDAANLARQSRVDAATADFNDRVLSLDTDKFNFTQRDSLANKKLDIIDMLGSRTGPQDWVKYNSMLNQLSPPDPSRSQEIDVFSILDGLVKESTPQAPKLRQDVLGNTDYSALTAANAEGAKQINAQPQSWEDIFNQVKSSYGATAPNLPQTNYYQPTAQPGNYSSGATNNPPANVETNEPLFSGVRNTDVAGVPKGGSALQVTGLAGPSYGRDYKGWSVSNPATGTMYNPDDEIGAGTNVWLTRLGMGGVMVGGRPMALVGDGTGKTPNKDSEIAMASVTPDGKPKLDVMNPKQTKKVLKKGVKPKRMASGGSLAPSGSTMTFNQYSPGDLGKQPFIQKLRGERASNPYMGFGGQLSNPEIGVSNMPWAINLKDFHNMAGSEQKAAQELYSTGFGVNFDDLYEQARRAAPIGRTLGPTRYA